MVQIIARFLRHNFTSESGKVFVWGRLSTLKMADEAHFSNILDQDVERNLKRILLTQLSNFFSEDDKQAGNCQRVKSSSSQMTNYPEKN